MEKAEGPRQWLTFPASASAAPLVARSRRRYPLVDLSVREPDIEAVIAKMYAETKAPPRQLPGRTEQVERPVS